MMDNPASNTLSATLRLQTWLLLGLLGITLAVFGRVCGHEFVHFDDNVLIYNNPHVTGLTWENIQWMFSNGSYARRYMPLGWLSLAIDYQLFGLSPHAYHTGNLLLHLMNVVLLFFLLKRLLLMACPSPEAATVPLWCAAMGALFWAVNPLRVENVAWASARIYCVAFLFFTLWLLAWLRAHDPATPETQRRVFYWLAVAAYAASLLTYPLAIFAPFALFVLEVFPLRRIGPRLADWWGPGSRRIWCDKIPFLAVAISVLALTFVALIHTDARYKPMTLEEFPPFSRLMQAFYIWGYYFWKPWAPYDLAISYMTLHSFNPTGLIFVSSAALVLAITVGVFLLRRRWPSALALWSCHLVLLIPVLGLTEYPHSAYDRYSYLHGALWSVTLAFGLRQLWQHRQQGQLAAIAIAGASALFALLAWQQVAVWRDTIPLYENLLAHVGEHPDRARSDTVLGVHYLRAGLTNAAIASFENAIHYEPLRPDRRWFNEGVLRAANSQLGDIYSHQGRLEKAAACYRAAAEEDPSGWAAAKAGFMLAQLHRPEEAVKWLQTAVRLQPDNASAQHELAVSLQSLGLEVEARRHFAEEQRVLELIKTVKR